MKHHDGETQHNDIMLQNKLNFYFTGSSNMKGSKRLRKYATFPFFFFWICYALPVYFDKNRNINNEAKKYCVDELVRPTFSVCMSRMSSINGTHILKAYCYLDFYAINIFNTDKYPMSPGTRDRSTCGDWLIVAGRRGRSFNVFPNFSIVAVHYLVPGIG
jgi:hypothetical protein